MKQTAFLRKQEVRFLYGVIKKIEYLLKLCFFMKDAMRKCKEMWQE